MHSIRRLVCATALAPLILFSSHVTASTKTDGQPRPAKQLRNGISVGKPKVFDNRTLTLMLENLSQTFQSMQAQFVQRDTLAAALATIQGFRSSEVNRSFSINEVGTAGVTTTDEANQTATDGVLQPSTSKVTTTTTQAAVTPTPPSLDTTIPAFSGFTPNFGQSASDLLSEQVNLSYQIFNLRMILERSLSDRLLDNGARRQAVLGFNVTIDPPRTATDSVAVVEITMKAESCSPGDLSLVALMPQEKTYNSATVSTKSNAFGGSAVVNLFQIGFSERRRGQTFYLYRDNDTVAYERMQPGDPNTIVFGWMFRPVLGRRAVSPGLRQLFAVASLPASDACSGPQDDKTQCPPIRLSAGVKTFWKKYDADTLTSFDDKDANRAARLRYALTFGLTKPEIFQANRYLDEATYADVVVQSTAAYEHGLGPKIDNVTWTPVGTKNALVSAVGENFFSGTQVTLGDKTYSGNGDGLVLKSNNAFDLMTTLDAMSAGPGAVSGRYGSAIPFVMGDKMVGTGASAQPEKGISIASLEIGPALSGLHTVELFLTARDGSGLTIADLPSSSPLIAVNGTTMALPYFLSDFVTDDDQKQNQVYLRGSIPATMLAKGHAVVGVSWPFLTDEWRDVMRSTDPATAYEVLRIGDKSLMLLTTKPGGFDTRTDDRPTEKFTRGQCWNLFAGGTAFPLKTASCPDGDNQSESVGKSAIILNLTGAIPDKIILIDPLSETYHLAVPKGAAAVDSSTKLTVRQFDSVWLDVPVEDAAKVASVEANGQMLKAIPKKPGADGTPGKSVKVLVTRDVTSKPGTVDFTVLDKDGEPIATPRLTITPCETCKETR